MRKRFRYEYKWLDRPVVIKQFRPLYNRRPHQAEHVSLTAAKLYEHLGRTAYLLEEMELHDMAVLRCLNLSLLLKRTASSKAPPKATEQLSRAYAAATIVDKVSKDKSLRSRYADYSRSMGSKVGSDTLTLYINMMFGLSAMREPDWRRASTFLKDASLAAERAGGGRRYEEAMHSLGLSQFFSGGLQACLTTYQSAREMCEARRADPKMLVKLTVGLCVPMLAFNQPHEACEVLEGLVDRMDAQNRPGARHDAIFANACGLLALTQLRLGNKDTARDRAENALETFKHTGNSALATFYGLAAAVEVLIRLLAESDSKLDYDAAKASAAALTRGTAQRRHDRSRRGGRAYGLVHVRVAQARRRARTGGFPLRLRWINFGSASIRVGKMAAALNAVQEEVAESASLTVPAGAPSPAVEGKQHTKSKRRGSALNYIMGGGGKNSMMQPVHNIPDRDNLSPRRVD